eukprot:gene12657-6557_t
MNRKNEDVLNLFLKICYNYPYQSTEELTNNTNKETKKEIIKLSKYISNPNEKNVKNLRVYFGSGIYKIYVLPALEFFKKSLRFHYPSKIYPTLLPLQQTTFKSTPKIIKREIRMDHDFVSFSFLKILKKYGRDTNFQLESVLKSHEEFTNPIELNLLRHLISAFLNENNEFFIKIKEEKLIEDSKIPKTEENQVKEKKFWIEKRGLEIPFWARRKSIKKPKNKLQKTKISTQYLE